MAVNYYREIRPVTDRIRKLYKQIVEPELKNLLEFEYVEDPNVSQDDSITEKIGRLFRKFRINYYGQEYPIDGDPNTGKFRRKLENVVSDSSKALAAFHKSRFDQNANFVINVDPLKREPWLSGYLSDWTVQNVNLIVDLPEFAIDSMEALVTNSVMRGDSQTFLKDQIVNLLGTTESRARLIARDQTNKMYGTLTELRSKFNGWEFYEWDTTEDRRVRPDHERLNGKIFKFSEPPVTVRTGKRAGERNNPGQDIQCRCVALVVLDREVINQLKRNPDGSYSVPAIKAA
jgi:SPP1 gp7 family putative phage head morphogenesis protein